MEQDWEDVFRRWAAPPSQTEQAKCDNAERAIRKAIEASPDLNRRTIKVFAQGSYRNNTNVRQDSDVDICVLCTDVFFTDYSMSKGLSDADVGLILADYQYTQFKNEVWAALVSHFGQAAVARGNKAFDVHENTYRIDADVVACFEHRRYNPDRTYHSGTELRPDKGGRIINWPQQNYDNGVWKNSQTGRRFKSIVRIIKRLRIEMEKESIAETNSIPGYLIECLVWNVPNKGFGHATYVADVQYALAHIFNETRSDSSCGEWGEVNELKYLFRPSQPWTHQQANVFSDAAWNYIGYE
jgi:hypothetical protein